MGVEINGTEEWDSLYWSLNLPLQMWPTDKDIQTIYYPDETVSEAKEPRD